MAKSFSFADVHTRRLFEDWMDRWLNDHPDYSLEVEGGRQYGKIWKRLGNQTSRSIVFFVDQYGNLYQADSARARGRMVMNVRDVQPARDGRKRIRTTKRTKSARSKPTARQQAYISRKIPILMDEGYEQPQAVAIAYRMAGVPERKSRK